MIRSSLVLTCLALIVAPVVACTGGDLSVGRTEQQLQTKKDGSATGNGTICSWDDTAAYDAAVSSSQGPAGAVPGYNPDEPASSPPYDPGNEPAPGAERLPPDGNTTQPPNVTPAEPPTPIAKGPYNVGDDFPALDGCNECTCTTKGIMCTIRQCAPGGGTGPSDPGGGACDMMAKICPDGSSVGKVGPNCEWAPCPGSGGYACPDDAHQCPDGSYVGRTGPKCEFVCPTGPGACTADAFQCPNGKWVGRTGPNCAFVCD